MTVDAAFSVASGGGARQVWIIRHAQTEWSVNGRHTGRTDIPLTPTGIAAAEALRPWVKTVQFERVFSSHSLARLKRRACVAWSRRCSPNHC